MESGKRPVVIPALGVQRNKFVSPENVVGGTKTESYNEGRSFLFGTGADNLFGFEDDEGPMW